MWGFESDMTSRYDETSRINSHRLYVKLQIGTLKLAKISFEGGELHAVLLIIYKYFFHENVFVCVNWILTTFKSMTKPLGTNLNNFFVT